MGAAVQHDPILAELARLRAAVLADASLAASLVEIWRPDVFAARAAEAAAERGIALDARQIDDLRCRIGPRRTAVLDIAPPAGWLPARFVRPGDEAELAWAHFGARRLDGSVYADILQTVTGLPFNGLFGFSTPLPAAPPPGALAPAGLIFHMSRCGSTLASRMLAACDANIVVAEAAAIDRVVRADSEGLDEDARVARLRAIVGAFGQPRTRAERRLFLKLDSWHACALPLFRRAFPSTPWVFLHRDPVEVLVSLMRAPSFQMTPELVSPAFLGVDWRGEKPDEDYAARALAAICGAALSGLDAAGLIVGYDELPEAIWTRVLPHFGVTPTPDEVSAMQAAAGRDAKAPARAFQPDSADKQAAASEAARQAVRTHLADVCARLAAARQSAP